MYIGGGVLAVIIIILIWLLYSVFDTPPCEGSP